MNRNEGKIDRVMRVAAGLVLVGVAYFSPYGWLTIFGIVLLLTGIVGFCPLYRIVGVDTCRARS